MGNRAVFDSSTNLYLILPKRSIFRIIQDGKIIHIGVGKSWNMKIKEPGVYRLESFYKNKPWIFSNPIVLTDDKNGQ